MFWPAVLVATAGASVGGAITWWMGYGAERAYEAVTHKHPDGTRPQVAAPLRRQDLPAVLAADRRRPDLCRRRLDEAAVLALPALHAIGKFGRYS
jgi:hypothetical protein